MLAQTIPPQEVIVIDDGSDEKVVIVGHPDDLSYRAVRVIRVTNRGLPAARNTGLMLAKTESIIFLDADDWLDPTYIEKTLPHLKNGADIVLTGLQEHGPTRHGTYTPGYDKPWHQVTLDDLRQMNRFFYCAHMHTETLREVGGYNPLMAGPWNNGGGYEDWDLWITLMAHDAKFAAVNEPLFNYNTATPNSMLARAERNRDALTAEMRRHHPDWPDPPGPKTHEQRLGVLGKPRPS